MASETPIKNNLISQYMAGEEVQTIGIENVFNNLLAENIPSFEKDMVQV
jgi:hypothetical protein